MPFFLHWGRDLGPLPDAALAQLADAIVPAVSPSSIDAPLRLSLLPVESEGWSGLPGIAGANDAGPLSPAFVLAGLDRSGERDIRVRLVDEILGLEVLVELGIDTGGVLESRIGVTNRAPAAFTLSRLAATLPVPARARELLDFTGRWSHERRPQRRSLEHGSWSRQTRHGRTGHDSPFALVAGTDGFGFQRGEVWALHVAFSGDQHLSADSHATGHALLSGGELLAAGEVRLETGQSHQSPPVVAAFSADGLDGISSRFHAHVRERHPLAARKVIVNTWEAVYFDQDIDRLAALAETAASVGVERFVLDDGWMTGRIDDRRALGDWTVDPIRWPEGLHPLIDRVAALGMDFGLWVEPEMVSTDSDLARAHPEWLLRGRSDRLPQPWRQQFALDLGNPDAFENILGQLTALLDEYPIAYLKWDQNRDLLGGSSLRQTRATYRLMDALRERYPGLEIESCSSGGARVDLGVIERTDRMWVSDTNDPLERQSIQRWTGLLLPPEYLGSHLGAPTAHTTGRTSDMGLRLATAFFLSAGIEWDLSQADAADLRAISTWIARYKEFRALLHSGRTVRADAADPALLAHGIVAPDASEAVFAVVCLAAPRDAVPAPVLFPGLSPEVTYRIEVLDLGAGPRVMQDLAPPWLGSGNLTLPGRVLGEVGIAMPLLLPAQALVLRFSTV